MVDKEYIERSALIKRIDEHGAKLGITIPNRCNFKDIVGMTPTVDVVEVVRCKDCAHYIEMKGYDYNGRKRRACLFHSSLRNENAYCSDGIRRAKK